MKKEPDNKTVGEADSPIPRSALRTPHSGAEIMPLPMRKVVAVAVRGIRIRIWRSVLVVSCIMLAIAFLTYILSVDAFSRHVTERGSQLLVDKLISEGLLDQANAANQRIQTYWMVGLALMISFVGIVNAMLMSVTERFREIGTMKCLGALDGFVLRLFLVESSFQAAAGTMAGLIVGLVMAYGEGLARYGTELWRLVPLGELGALLGACFLAGLIITILGALYPAYQAARMAPVMALRSEV